MPVLQAMPEQRAQPVSDYFLQRHGIQLPMVRPSGPIYQQPFPMAEIFRSGNNGDRGPQNYEHSMLLIDYPPKEMAPQPQQPEEQLAFRSGDHEPQTDERSMVMVEQQPVQVAPLQEEPEQQPIRRSDAAAAAEPLQYERSPLELELERPAGEVSPQQPAVSGDPMSAGSPSEESVQEQGPPADQQPPEQESGVAAAQVTQQESSPPVRMPYQQGPPPFGVVFRSDEPYPGLSPPPAYQLEQVSWGAQPVQVPVYSDSFREQPPQRPLPIAYYPPDFPVKGGYRPFADQPPVYDASRASFGARPFAEDGPGMVPRPPGGVAPFPVPPSYLPETPLEEAKRDEVVPDKHEESHEGEKSKSDDSSEEDDDEAGDEIENKVKALKDAADVDEEVVPALVVFLRKKGHKAFHDKDSVGVPGKEDRFRRSPGIGSGSSSHSSSSSSSSSGPVYFGDGGGSYSSSSSQSSASSSSGAGAPLGIGASGPGVGGSSGFYGGGHVPPSGYGVSGGGGGGYGNNGYGNTGYGNTGYGNAGHGNAGYGNSGYGGGGGGGYGGGYGGGVGPSGGGGCATCDDSNVLLNRFGEADAGGGPFTVGGGGASKGQGVHSSASSSIDSTGKVTYTAFVGKH